MIALSVTAQTKMALHSAKHGFSNPIHGIVLGRNTADGGKNLQVVDVVPVCHEVPTKPIVDMALRLTDAYLHLHQKKGMLGGVKIVGWYTANSDGEDGGELPNPSACRIASSVAENINTNNEEGNAGGDCVLLLVFTSRLVNRIKDVADASSLPICAVFEKDRSRMFTQKVDDSRITTTTTHTDVAASVDRTRDVISKAMQRYLSNSSADRDDATCLNSIAMYDFVDHLTDCRDVDWIENRSVNDFIEETVG